MKNRLSAQDASFYFLEAGNTPMHVGSLAIVRPPRGGFDHEKLIQLVAERLRLVPRYRQKVREIAFGLARPVWIDDQDFDIEYHVRRSALPKPGSEAQLHELVARLISRPLDNTRPLWEMYIVEGLSRNRLAIFTKSHSALVDGESALDIGHVIIDALKNPAPLEQELWMPSAEPGGATLVVGALTEMVARPAEAVFAVRGLAADVAGMLAGPVRAAERAAAVVRTAASQAPSNPLNAPISRSRRYAVVNTELEPYRKIRARYGCAINDVILTVITGALRNWLLSRGEPVAESTTVRAMVPISVYPNEDEFAPTGSDRTSPGGGGLESGDDIEEGADGDPQDRGHGLVSSFLIDLPVGEPNPVVRLVQVSHATAEIERQGGQRVTAQTMVRLSGFAPATLHALGARAASSFSQRMFNLMITNAPGPQAPMYVGGARVLEMYPVSPLLKNQTLSIALTSYDGHVYYGLNADRDAMSDVDVVAALLYESLEELSDASR